MKIEVISERDMTVFNTLISGIREYNIETLGDEETKPLSIVARGKSDELIGGVYGRTIYKHFFIDVVWVNKGDRGKGIGRAVMELAEAEAKKRGCVAAQVDTLSIQAPDFYEKLGFQIVGKAPGITEDHSRYFLFKKFQ